MELNDYKTLGREPSGTKPLKLEEPKKPKKTFRMRILKKVAVRTVFFPFALLAWILELVRQFMQRSKPFIEYLLK